MYIFSTFIIFCMYKKGIDGIDSNIYFAFSPLYWICTILMHSVWSLKIMTGCTFFECMYSNTPAQLNFIKKAQIYNFSYSDLFLYA